MMIATAHYEKFGKQSFAALCTDGHSAGRNFPLLSVSNVKYGALC